MNNRFNNNTNTVGCNFVGCGCLVALLFSWWTDMQLDFWVSYLKGEQVDVPFIFAVLLNLFLGVFMLIVDIIGEIGKLVVS